MYLYDIISSYKQKTGFQSYNMLMGANEIHVYKERNTQTLQSLRDWGNIFLVKLYITKNTVL